MLECNLISGAHLHLSERKSEGKIKFNFYSVLVGVIWSTTYRSKSIKTLKKTFQDFQTEHNLRSETNYFVNLSHILSKINLVSNLKYSIILSKYLFMRWADNIISGRNDGSHQFSKFSVILIWLLCRTNERSVAGNVIFISPITEIYTKFDIF